MNHPTDTKIQEILSLKEQGNLFHGSPVPNIEVLKPSKPNISDTTNDFNIDTAVYSTDNIETSILFSIINRESFPEKIRNKEWNVIWRKDGSVIANIPLVWKSYIEKNIGYLYVLPHDTFLEKQAMQYKSKVEVVPFKSFIVTLQDYYSLGGQVEWTNN